MTLLKKYVVDQEVHNPLFNKVETYTSALHHCISSTQVLAGITMLLVEKGVIEKEEVMAIINKTSCGTVTDIREDEQ